jgi:CRP-like cAMP-binding protein
MREYSLNNELSLESALPPAQLARLAEAGGLRRLATGETIYHQGDLAGHIYLLRRGRIKTFMVNSSGLEALLRIHLPDSLLGLTAMTSERRRDATAVALEPCEVSVIKRADLIDLLKANAELGISLIQLVLDRMSDFHLRVGELSSNRVEQRLARALLSLSRADISACEPVEDSKILLTHEELAQLINSRRQTVTTVLSRFVQAGLISHEGRHLIVTDRQGLACLLPD